MRVAHIMRKYQPAEWGGTETALQRLTEGLGRHGVESVVFCPADGPGGATDARDPLAAAGCTVKRFRACVPVWGLRAAARRQMLAVGGNLLSFELPRLLAREPSLDIVHTHTLGRLGGIALAAARRRRVPGVVTIHGGVLDLPPKVRQELSAPVRGGLEWGRLFGWWWRARHVLADADAILTCNPREAELMSQQHPDKRIIVHPHGVHLAHHRTDHRAAALAAFPAIAGRKVLLCVGRIDAVKNQFWLVERAPQIFQRHPDALLVFAGACTDPVYGATLKREVATLGLAPRVLFTGGLPPGDPRLIGLMQTARVVLLPSLSETFGLVLLEAWAAGTPVIASRTSGASALIDHGENGWLFKLGDALSFHTALNRVLLEPELAARQAAAGARLVEREYDTTVLAGRMQALYYDLIEKKNALHHPA
ncbi:glycosyltransferase family 4 protein [Opitutus sp. GAS368]|uniref:glycosyltransferase family 4 protein n=1 Tax=Opitutus sp. GAS368 TaxID=1882749 RepID=UPI00087A4F4C|nr:glycosyltransferase family 4 protein [Opitutus sp. GAS368]SDS41673.1 Glycosyltransferase involved in cell wall bisynthesis [Opitutus sp. GAS368]